MTSSLGPFIKEILPVILSGLSDENEGVREVALRAGQVLVGVLGQEFALEILPGLRAGLYEDDDRIRLSALTLLGELLYLVAETKAVGVAPGIDDDDDEMTASGSLIYCTLCTCNEHNNKLYTSFN
jgi:hypothetical protein